MLKCLDLRNFGFDDFSKTRLKGFCHFYKITDCSKSIRGILFSFKYVVVDSLRYLKTKIDKINLLQSVLLKLFCLENLGEFEADRHL